jgi:L-aspartate oxidase
MQESAGVIRDEGSLIRALGVITGLEQSARGDPRLANMLTTAKLIAASALIRKESRGAHFRSDYPASDPGLARRSFLTLEDANRIAREAAETQRRVGRHAKPLLAALRRAALHA